MRIAAALLESYERQVQSVEGALKVTAPLSCAQPPLAMWLPFLKTQEQFVLLDLPVLSSYQADTCLLCGDYCKDRIWMVRRHCKG